eukprot:scaffold39600_cov46-Cyclotella_meneghiniana.AAC.4
MQQEEKNRPVEEQHRHVQTTTTFTEHHTNSLILPETWMRKNYCKIDSPGDDSNSKFSLCGTSLPPS